MKILHLTKKYPSALGGDAVVVSNLRRQQQAAGHRVVIVASNCDEIASAAGIYKFGLKDTPADLDAITMRRLISLAALFFKIFGIVRRERPDVIHTHSVDLAFVASFAARLQHIPLVHTFHIVTFYDDTQPLLRRSTEVWLAKRAKPYLTTAPNQYDVQKLRAAGLKQTVLLPNGVDVAFWDIGKHTSSSEAFVFVAVGRLESQKGYAYLIKAAALLASLRPKAFRIVLIGEGSQQAALQQLARAIHVEDIVILAGRKTPEQIRAMLSEADAAVFSSLYETTPITLLEAWAAAVPAVATRVGILRDAQADHGQAYIIPIKDEQALMEAMHRCMADAPERKAIAAKGHAEAKKYAWPIIARSAEALYRSAV